MPKAKRPATESSYPWGVSIFLLIAVGLIYGQTLGYPLLGHDDHGFVSDNPQITAGVTVEGFRWALTQGPFGEWYPLATLSHMLDCQLFGLAPWGHHLTNVLLHAATSVGLFLVLRSMTGERYGPARLRPPCSPSIPSTSRAWLGFQSGATC